MPEAITEFQPSHTQVVREFYIAIAQQRKTSRLTQVLLERTAVTRSWQAGILGIAGIHIQQRPGWPTILMALTAWSVGIGLAWYFWFNYEYDHQAQNRAQSLVKDLLEAKATAKGNAWVMVDDKRVLGVAALRVERNEEGSIQSLTGVESRIELALVQNAIQFARKKHVKAITRDTTWSVSPL